MYELTIETKFSAAHQLKNYQGKCERLHGHNWKVEVHVTSPVLDNIGLAIDFKVLKETTNGLLEKLEHVYLNDVPPFTRLNPSSENIAKWLYEGLMDKLTGTAVKVAKVTIWESDTASASYYEQD